MKRKIALLLLLTGFVATQLLAEATEAKTDAASGMTADQVVEKSIEARGGREAWENVKTARMTGKMMMGPGMEAPFVIEFRRPQMVRLEFTMQGMTGIQAYDGESGWFVMPFMGKTDPETMGDDQLDMIKEQADFDGPLFDYKAKGNEVELVGKEDIEGTEAYKLKVTRADGNVQYSYLDAEHFLEFKAEAKRKIPQMGTEVSISTVYGDFKEVDGILMPFSIEQTAEGAPSGQVITIENVELNPDIPDSRFAMPAPTAAEEEAADQGGE